MQYRPICIISLALVGCAQTDPATVSDWDLCRYTMRGGNNAVVASNEASRRGLDCRQLYPAIIAREQAQAQQLQSTINVMRAMQPPPAPALPLPQTCMSVVNGQVITTSCR
jgi:hypothetical protein